MKKLHLTFAAASLSIVCTCCESLAGEGVHTFFKSKETYDELGDFVEKYVRDDIRFTFNDFDARWGIADVKFSNFKSQLEPCIGVGILERVTCSVTLVPQRGVRHYMPVAWSIIDDMSDVEKLTEMVDSSFPASAAMTNVFSNEWCDELSKRAKAVKDALSSNTVFNVVKAPIGVPVKDFTGAFVASVYRARDERGIFHPLKKTKLQFEMIEYESRMQPAHLWTRDPDGKGEEDPDDAKEDDPGGPFDYTLVTEKVLRELGGVPSTMDDEVRAIKESHAIHVRDFAVTYVALTRMLREYRDVVEGTYERKIRDEACQKKLYPARQEAEQAISQEEKREFQAKQELRKRKNEVAQAIRMRDTNKKNLARAEEAHAKAVAAVERVRAANASGQESPRRGRRRFQGGRNAENREATCRAKVESARRQLEAAEAKLVAAEQSLEEARTGCAAATASLKKTELEQKERVKAVSEAIAEEVRAAQNAKKARLEAEIKSAAAQLDEAWKAIAVPSRPARR